MSKGNKKGLVPKLRFPEFSDSGSWDRKALSQTCEVNPSADELPETFVYIDLESVEAGRLLQKKIISREGAPSRAQRLLEKGDVVFQMVRPYQKNNYFFLPSDDLDYVASTGYAQLRAHELNSYLFQYLHNDTFVDRVLEKCTGSNYPAINSKNLSKITVEIPSSEEQQKIADCLSSLDELIAAHTKKYEALQSCKKGLMQNLFPAEGKTLPALRFPEFEGAGAWKESTLGKLVDIRSGFSPSRYDLSNKAKYAFLKVEDLNNCEKYQLLSRQYSNDVDGLVPANSIIFPKRGAAILLNKVRVNIREVLMDTNLMALTPNKKVLIEFLYYNIVSVGLFKIADTSTIPQINNKHINPYHIYIPSKPEQQKIADCLSSIDDLITAQAQKIENLKAHKKGLMQQLFPATEEGDS